MTVCILGAGAFGTALAIALSETNDIRLWGRNAEEMAKVEATRKNSKLPGPVLGASIKITSDSQTAIQGADFILSAVPLQSTHTTLKSLVGYFEGQPLIGCSKGVDLTTGQGGYSILKTSYPDGPIGLLTGPSFAADIARGLPTALTLASEDRQAVGNWQAQLSNDTLRLYVSHDPIGAELGAALKNVIAIACGATIGAGLGESARAALITRGQAEIMRYATQRGARPETLAGLSGFGDLCLTCTSDKSRNYRYGHALGQGKAFDPAITIEGKATALALVPIMQRLNIDMPITKAVADLCSGTVTVSQALAALMARPLRRES